MNLQDIKARVDCDELAARLGLVKPRGHKLYKSPHHDDSNPSLSVYESGRKWRDHSRDVGGDAVDLVAYVLGMDTADALNWLRDAYGFPRTPRPAQGTPQREKSRAEYIADKCLADADKALPYLTELRGIPEFTVRAAIKARSLGFNSWTSPTVAAGSVGHGGPAVAFICSAAAGEIKAVDLRYLDPDLNGGVKTQSQGEKQGHPWVMDRRKLANARTVIVVESAINALCVEACAIPGTVGLALRGTGNWRHIDWRAYRGKLVVLALDADLPDSEGHRPGPEAAWQIYDACTAADVSCLLVDQSDWYADKLNDVNDVLKARRIDGLREALKAFEPWAIPGLPGRDPDELRGARRRIFLPAHDYGIYWRYRCKPDFTMVVKKIGDGEDGEEKLEMDDVCGFRVASISRVQIQSAGATMTGDEDASPRTVFAVSVQTPRHGPKLLRTVLQDERLHNVEHWKKLGPVFNPQRFSRLVNILERSADLGARDAVNFVGLAFRAGKPALIQGPDCYFSEPEKQCPYSNLVFPSGTPADAAAVLRAYTATFAKQSAALLLCWSLGAHLKAFLGFWPHFDLQGEKGSGKSTLTKALERAIGFTMFGGQSLETAFRLLCSISHTSHPIGWEEISARKQETLSAAVAFLQESYQHSITHRGPELTEYLQCAPVLLAGEDVPVKSLTGKLVRTDLTRKQGTPLPDALPRFPVADWIRWLCQLDRAQVRDLQRQWEDWLRPLCRAQAHDAGAKRMVTNYACLALAHGLLREFTGCDDLRDPFEAALVAEMNAHIAETSAEREPYIWILETVLGDIDAGHYQHSYRFIELELDEPDSHGVTRPRCLVLRPGHIIQHLSTSTRLRALWDSLPIKSTKALSAQLLRSPGLVVKQDLDVTIRASRAQHMWALSTSALARLGLFVSVPEDRIGGPGN